MQDVLLEDYTDFLCNSDLSIAVQSEGNNMQVIVLNIIWPLGKHGCSTMKMVGGPKDLSGKKLCSIDTIYPLFCETSQ